MKEEVSHEKPKWRWLLLPLSPIAILIGVIVGLVKFFKRKKEANFENRNIFN